MDTLGRTRVPKTGEIASTLDREDRYSGAVGPTSLQSAEKAKSLTHELAHHLLHRDARALEAEQPTLEVEAKGTAYAVLSYFGVDASDYSFAYVAHWAEQKEVVKAVLSSIQKTAREIIEAVENGNSQQTVADDRGAA
jgi:hypothetical protein